MTPSFSVVKSLIRQCNLILCCSEPETQPDPRCSLGGWLPPSSCRHLLVNLYQVSGRHGLKLIAETQPDPVGPECGCWWLLKFWQFTAVAARSTVASLLSVVKSLTLQCNLIVRCSEAGTQPDPVVRCNLILCCSEPETQPDGTSFEKVDTCWLGVCTLKLDG